MSDDSYSNNPSAQDWLILSFLSLVWGSSFILIKYSLKYFEPLQVGGLRILISALAFLPIFIYQFNKIPWNKWKYLALVGICGSGLPAFLFPLAQMKLSSSVSGILNTMTPLFTLIIGYVLFKNKVSTNKIISVLIGLVGAWILVSYGEKIKIDENIKYGLYILLATICYGTSVNIIASKLKSINATLLSAVSFTFLLPFGLAIFFLTGTYQTISTTPEIMTGLGYVLLLSLLGTFLASLLFYKMVQRTNAIFGSSITYVIPIVSTAWGVFDGESFSIFHLLGAFLILAGVFLSRKS